ncbi:hypothetical protein J437_LFUL019732 [Ladona fulva]|nr:hypothetical protein J437_LFUL019732 [Ladona fulva]
MFFHTDYRPLVRDANHWVLDEQTQTAPHLMPPPFLVDIDGNPHPPALQRLVPGRRNCRDEQLVPNILVGAGGEQEVIEGLPSENNGNPRSNIDQMIAELMQQREYAVDVDQQPAGDEESERLRGNRGLQRIPGPDEQLQLAIPHNQPTLERALFSSCSAQMICAAFSSGGSFLAAGNADHNVRVYHMFGDDGPVRILEEEAHTDGVDSIQWANKSLRFVSGSKDGTAIVWNFERQRWNTMKLRMNTKLPGNSDSEAEDGKLKLKVTMVGWDLSDEWVITAVNDHSLKVWNSTSGNLVHILKAHQDEVFVLEAHPIDAGVLLSAGHDGQILVWDVLKGGAPVASYYNSIQGQGHGAVFDAKWSPDGHSMAATDSHGHLLLFGFGSNERFRKVTARLGVWGIVGPGGGGRTGPRRSGDIEGVRQSSGNWQRGDTSVLWAKRVLVPPLSSNTIRLIQDK